MRHPLLGSRATSSRWLLLLPLLTGSPQEGQGAETGEALATLVMEPVAIPLGDGRTGAAERGALEVPIVRADPSSKRIAVDVWRFPAAEGADPGAPPLFLLHGGPGWGGMEPDQVQWESLVADRIRHADLVVVGQRGIGTSLPNTTCGEREGAGPGETPPEDRESAGRALQERCGRCRAYWEGQGYDLGGLNVIEAAADVDDVRRLLGYERIALSGTSFGSHWAMTVMRAYPEIVERALLSGLEGPDHTYDSPSGILGALEGIAAAAAASPALRDRIPEGGLVEAFGYLLDSIEEEPFDVEVLHPRTGRPEPVRIDAERLRSLALGISGRASSRSGIRTWPADIIRLVEGDFEHAAHALLASEEPGTLPTASFFMLDCGSGISPARLERLRADPAQRLVGDQTWWYQTACAAWGSDLGEAFRAEFRTEIPTLVVQGTWDTSTPYTNALELVPCFANLRFVSVEGGSHGALSEAMDLEPGFREKVRTWLATGRDEGLPQRIELPAPRWALPPG